MGEDKDQISELQREWRAIVLSQLKDLQTEQKSQSAKIELMSTEEDVETKNSALITRIDAQDARIKDLETARAKFVGIVLAVNVVAIIVAWIIERGWVK